MLTSLPRIRSVYGELYANKNVVALPCTDLNEDHTNVFVKDVRMLRDMNINMRVRALGQEQGRIFRDLLGEDVVDVQPPSSGLPLHNAISEIAASANGKIEELILLRPEGGIIKNGSVLPALSGSKIDTLYDSNPAISSVLNQIQLAVTRIGKIVIIKPDGLSAEMTTWMGAGTMFFDHTIVKASRVEMIEEPIFDAAYESNVAEGWFCERSDEELRILKNAHRIVRAKLSALGGYTLQSLGQKVQELNLLWGAVEGSGLGPIIMEQVLNDANGNTLFACTINPAAMKLFESFDFEPWGTIEEAKATRWQEMPQHLQQYDTEKKGRNPHLYYRKPKPVRAT